MVQTTCEPGTGCVVSNDKLIEWWHPDNGMDDCQTGATLPEVICDNCRDVAVSNILAAFMSCVTLLFALFGCVNRMKYISDCPVQKLLGCIADTWGALTLTYALYEFQTKCLWYMPSSFDGYKLEYVPGPGIAMYVFCVVSGYIRAILHWLTPLPGQGVGCSCQLPAMDHAHETFMALNQWQTDTRREWSRTCLCNSLFMTFASANLKSTY